MVKNPLYVSRSVLNSDDLIKWAKEQNFPVCLHPDNFHITIAYSKEPVDWSNWRPKENKIILRNPNRFVTKFGKCIVLRVHSPKLHERWKEFINAGCSWDYEDYSPHITITYNGEDIDIDNIAPYKGDIILGPEVFEELNESGSDIVSKIQHISLDESVFRLTPENEDSLYDQFKMTYEKSTGKSWDKEKFISRARQWELYGTDKGFIALRPQRSGFYKLTGMAGDPRGIIQGLQELQQTNLPVWGAISENLVKIAKKQGMIVPHDIPGGNRILQFVLKMIPSYVFGSDDVSIGQDGSINIGYTDVGDAKKFFICNKQYLLALTKMDGFAEKVASIPGAKLFFKMFGIQL